MNPSHSQKRLVSRSSGLVVLPDSVRAMLVLIVAGRGSGKSITIGRGIAAQDCIRGKPQVIIDPVGTVGDNLLDELARLPEPERSQALTRVYYYDMSGQSGYLSAWPLFVQRPGQSLYAAAQVFSEVVERSDPNLASAPVEGLNSFLENITAVGMAATALGCQVTEAELLLTPEPPVVERLTRLAQEAPEARAIVRYLLETLPSLKPADKERKLSSFRRKIAVFQLDPTLRAMMGATAPQVDWAGAVERGETLIFDFRFVSQANRRLLLLWVFRRFLEFVRSRGPGRHTPVGLVIDELLALYHLDAQAGQSIFASDIDELVNILSRGFRINLTFALQEIFQLDPRAQQTLLSAGTKIFGVTSNQEAARTIAGILHHYDPTLIKALEPIYNGQGNLVDAQPRYWSAEEQQLLVASELRRLKPFHFLVSLAGSEGDGVGKVLPLYVPAKERNVWVDEEVVASLRQTMGKKCGVSKEILLTQIEKRQAELLMTTRNTSRGEDVHGRLGGHDQTSARTGETPLDIYADFGESARPQDNEAAQAP